MKIYPPTYKPVTEEKPVISVAKKTAAINKVKAHMTENRGYYLEELVEVAQVELHKSGPHINNDEVVVWIKELNTTWAWHPPEPIAEPIPEPVVEPKEL